jgi:hypothetical protein
MRNNLQRQLRELTEATQEATRSLPPDEARAVRAASLARARKLVERRSIGPELRVVDRRPLPPPGVTGWRRDGFRR